MLSVFLSVPLYGLVSVPFLLYDICPFLCIYSTMFGQGGPSQFIPLDLVLLVLQVMSLSL